MNLIVALYLSVMIADTGKTMSIISSLRFDTVEKCEEFVLRMSEGYPYTRNDDNALVLIEPKTGNILTARCYEDKDD